MATKPASARWWQRLRGRRRGFDPGLTTGSDAGTGPPFDPDDRPTMQLTFAAMGRISKAGGRVLPAHIAVAEALMARLGFDADHRRQAIAWFRAGKAPEFPFLRLVGPCRREFAADPALQDFVVDWLARSALITDAEPARRALVALLRALGIDTVPLPARLARLRVRLQEEQQLDAARRLLGVEAGADAKAIRLAYRRLVARYHPDRLSPRASGAEVARAEQRMTELRTALETLLDGHA